MTQDLKELAEAASSEWFADWSKKLAPIIERALLKQREAFEARIADFECSRDYAIKLLVNALGLYGNSRTIEYYAKLASTRLKQAESARDEAVAQTLERCAQLADEATRPTTIPATGIVTIKTGDSLATRIRALSTDVGGMVLVPREPTEAMMEEGSRVCRRSSVAKDVYKAMLAAAVVESGKE
jgi:phage I-like protein